MQVYSQFLAQQKPILDLDRVQRKLGTRKLKIPEPGTETGTRKFKNMITRNLTRNQEQNQDLEAFIPVLNRILLV